MWHNASMDFEGYEDNLGRMQRRVRRIGRALRWRAKALAGAPRKILVETRWRLGDEIMAMPIFESFRATYPADIVAVLTNFPILYENHPFVDAVNDESFVPDHYVLLRGAPRTVRRIEAYAAAARVVTPVSRPHLYYESWYAPQLAELPVGNGPLVAVAAGTTWPTKRWPRDRWIQLCSRLAARGCHIVELGKGHESLGIGWCLVDQTTIREAACVLHRADLLVSCDSGLMHLALAAGARVVALFGPTDPEILVQNEPNLYAMRSQLPCHGYWNRPGPTPRTDVCPLGHASCLDDISVEMVLETVSKRITLI